MYKFILRFFMFRMAEGDGGGGTSLLNTQQHAPDNQQQNQQQQNQQQAPTPAALKFSELLTETGDFKPDWQNSLPEDLKNEPALKNFHQFPALVKSLVHAQKSIGKDKIAIPGEHATADEINEYYTKLGRPATPEEYKFQKPETLPEGLTWDDSGNKVFAAKAHELGLTAKQAEALHSWYTESQIERAKGIPAMLEQQRTEAESALKKEWGAAFTQQLGLAQRAATTFGALEDFEKLGIGNNPAVLKFLAKVGASISEDKLKGNQASALIPGDAKAKINEIKGDPKHPYNNSEHPAHKQAVADMTKLYEHAYPSA